MFSEICEIDLQKFINYSLNSRYGIQQFLNCTGVPNPLGRRRPAQNTTVSPLQARQRQSHSQVRNCQKPNCFPPPLFPQNHSSVIPRQWLHLLSLNRGPFFISMTMARRKEPKEEVTKIGNMQLHTNANYIEFLPKVLFICIHLCCLGRAFVLQHSAVLSSHKYCIHCKCSTWHVAVDLQDRWRPVYLLTKKTGSSILINKITCLCHWK